MVSVSNGPIDVRSQILVAATRLFAAKGFDGTSLQVIADEVGVTKPAVLHYYESKQALHRAVLDVVMSRWRNTLPRLLVAATSNTDFEAFFEELYRFFAEEPDHARLFLREGLDRPEEIRELLRGPAHPWLSGVAGFIRRGQSGKRRRVGKDVDPEAYVVHVLLQVISAVAASSVCSVAVDPEVDGTWRYEHELARMARASLFMHEVSAVQGAQRSSGPKKR